jgi:hypothetical protein
MICHLTLDEAKEIIYQHLKQIGYDIEPVEDDQGDIEHVFFDDQSQYGSPEFWFTLNGWNIKNGCDHK